MKPTIVGVDPGTTVGLCVLDFRGKVLRIFSQKNISQAEIVKEILKHGKPIIISTDKKKVPDYVQGLGSSLGCRVYTPKEDLKSEEKSRVVDEQGLREEINDDHQKDACASALFAFKRFKDSIERIEKEAKKKPSTKVFQKVFVDNSNIKKALREEVEENRDKNDKSRKAEKEVKKSARERKVDSELQERYKKIKRQIKSLEKNNTLLKNKIQRMSSKEKSKEKDKLKQIKEEVRKVVRNNDAERRLLRNLLSNLREHNSKLKRKLKVRKAHQNKLKGLAVDEKKGCCWYCKELNEKEFKTMDLDKNNEIIVKEITNIKNSIIKELKERKTELRYKEGNKKIINQLKEEGINLSNIEGLKLTIFKNLAFFNKKAKEDIIKKKSIMEDIIQEYKHKRKKS